MSQSPHCLALHQFYHKPTRRLAAFCPENFTTPQPTQPSQRSSTSVARPSSYPTKEQKKIKKNRRLLTKCLVLNGITTCSHYCGQAPKRLSTQQRSQNFVALSRTQIHISGHRCGDDRNLDSFCNDIDAGCGCSCSESYYRRSCDHAPSIQRSLWCSWKSAIDSVTGRKHSCIDIPGAVTELFHGEPLNSRIRFRTWFVSGDRKPEL